MGYEFLSPEDFDILGVFVFLFLTVSSSIFLFTSFEPNFWYWLLILLIGLGGLLIDSFIVLKEFFL